MKEYCELHFYKENCHSKSMWLRYNKENCPYCKLEASESRVREQQEALEVFHKERFEQVQKELQLEARVRELEEYKNALSTELAAHMVAVANQKDRITELEEKNKGLKALFNLANKAYKRLKQAEPGVLMDRITELEYELKKHSGCDTWYCDVFVQGLNNKIAELQAENKFNARGWQVRNDALHKLVVKLEAENTRLKEELSTAHDEIELLNSEVDKMQTKTSRYESAVEVEGTLVEAYGIHFGSKAFTALNSSFEQGQRVKVLVMK